MNNGRIVAIANFVNRNQKIDIDIPADLTAHELVIGLNNAFHLGMNVPDVSSCYLSVENPIVLLKGNRTLEELGLRNGSIINIIS